MNTLLKALCLVLVALVANIAAPRISEAASAAESDRRWLR